MNDRLNVIGTDGTATMTGKKSGCIASLETKLGRPFTMDCVLAASP